MPTERVPDSLRRRCSRACTTCKRRKERCDGTHPCGRCVERGVGRQCSYTVDQHASRRVARRSESRSTRARTVTPGSSGAASLDAGSYRSDPAMALGIPTFPSPRSLLWRQRWLRSSCGDSGNLSFLEDILPLARRAIGPCPLVDGPSQSQVAEAQPPAGEVPNQPPSKPTVEEGCHLARWCMRATSYMLRAVDGPRILEQMRQWLGRDDEDSAAVSAANYLILAVVALSCHEEKDYIAEAYFQYGSQLVFPRLMDQSSVGLIHCYMLMAFYLILVSRLDAALDYVGLAARSAYTLGIHCADVSHLFVEEELTDSERLWKALRQLDLFVSTTLGRPISTRETRDTKVSERYSATLDLSVIIETTILALQSERGIEKGLLDRLTEHQRVWSTRMMGGLEADGITPDGLGGESGIVYADVKGSYYWSVMLLTRLSLLEYASRHISRSQTEPSTVLDQNLHFSGGVSDKVFAYAGVCSAIRSMDLLQDMLPLSNVPKRLPFTVNLAFSAALTLGVAVFAGLDQTFPIEKGLHISKGLLEKFERHDPLAKRYLGIVEDLQDARDRYVEKRTRQVMEDVEALVGGLVGQIHDGASPGAPRSEEELAHMSTASSGLAEGLEWPLEVGSSEPWEPADVAIVSESVVFEDDTLQGLHQDLMDGADGFEAQLTPGLSDTSYPFLPS